jgi:hypothetical protein
VKLLLHKKGKLLGDLDLGPGVTTIGRHPDNDIALSDRAVSGHHACIHLGQGQAMLKDLGSTNGTFVNGERISVRDLNDGDMITIGNYGLAFDGDDGESRDTEPTQVLRLDKPGMPPVPVDARSTRQIRKWRAEMRGGGPDPRAQRSICLRIMSGCNQGRHLDLLMPVTALGEPGNEVVVFIRNGDDLQIRLVHAGSGTVFVDDAPLGVEAVQLKHNSVIRMGEVRMLVVYEAGADDMSAGTEDWTLE